MTMHFQLVLLILLVLGPYICLLFKQDSTDIISLRERVAAKFHMGWFPRLRKRGHAAYLYCIHKDQWNL
jgi:hypothetical protein